MDVKAPARTDESGLEPTFIKQLMVPNNPVYRLYGPEQPDVSVLSSFIAYVMPPPVVPIVSFEQLTLIKTETCIEVLVE